MTSCIVGKKIKAMGPGPLELFPFVLAILMAMAGGISEHMLTSWSSMNSVGTHIVGQTRVWQTVSVKRMESQFENRIGMSYFGLTT